MKLLRWSHRWQNKDLKISRNMGPFSKVLTHQKPFRIRQYKKNKSNTYPRTHTHQRTPMTFLLTAWMFTKSGCCLLTLCLPSSRADCPAPVSKAAVQISEQDLNSQTSRRKPVDRSGEVRLQLKPSELSEFKQQQQQKKRDWKGWKRCFQVSCERKQLLSV